MRILHVTPELPFHPGGSGGSTRQFRLLADLVGRGHVVDVVAPVHPDQEPGPGQLRDAGIALHALQRTANRSGDALSTLRASPGVAFDLPRLPLVAWQAEMFWRGMREPLRSALASGTPDAIVVEHDWAARWWRDLPPEIPRALTLENLSWRYYEQRAAVAPSRWRSAALRIEAQRFARFDARQLPHYDALLAMSELDRVEVAELVTTRTEVIPNGVDTTTIRATTPAVEPVAVFAGSMGYLPNAEALRWLLTDIWPRVREVVHGAQLLVVGRDVPDDLERSAPDGVVFTGFVDDIATVYARARIVLCPMLSGAGTRLKVVEGLATGLPLVSTTMGAQGVEIADDHDILLADGTEEFVAATVRALTDVDLARRIGDGGRRLAETVYDWHTIGGSLEALLLDLVANRRRAR